MEGVEDRRIRSSGNEGDLPRSKVTTEGIVTLPELVDNLDLPFTFAMVELKCIANFACTLSNLNFEISSISQ